MWRTRRRPQSALATTCHKPTSPDPVKLNAFGARPLATCKVDQLKRLDLSAQPLIDAA
jgi:hypothetical protein